MILEDYYDTNGIFSESEYELIICKGEFDWSKALSEEEKEKLHKNKRKKEVKDKGKGKKSKNASVESLNIVEEKPKVFCLFDIDFFVRKVCKF